MAIHQIAIDELKGIVPGGGTVIDVREVDEYVAGHIPLSVNIPYSTIEDNIDRFRSESDIYLVCRSGNRSQMVCEYLHDQDIVNVVNVATGILGWSASGGPLTQGDQP